MNYTKVEQIRQYRLASCDITSNCNLRCKFCFNDFSQKNFNMTGEIFQNMLKIIPYVPRTIEMDGKGFYFSCLWEPSINPAFLDLLEQIPDEAREYIFFTSNFAKKWDEASLERMAHANVDHINISIETLEREKYKELTGGTDFNYDCFFENLAMLSKVFSKYENAPKIRYISMALKSNYEELPSIVEECHNKYHAYLNEIRTPFEGEYLNQFFGELINQKEIDMLSEVFDKSDKNISYCLHDLTYLQNEDADKAVAVAETVQKVKKKKAEKTDLPLLTLEALPEWYYDIRLESNGNVSFNGNREAILYDASADYDTIFKNGLQRLIADEAARHALADDTLNVYKKINPFSYRKTHFVVDDCVEDDDFFSLRGWAGVKGVSSKNQWKILELSTNQGKHRKYYLCRNIIRLDVSETMKEDFDNAGFEVLINKAQLEGKELEARMYFYDRDKNRITYGASEKLDITIK